MRRLVVVLVAVLTVGMLAGPGVAGASGHTVDLCHATQSGRFVPISVSGNAAARHIANHGDAPVDGAVVGMPGYDFASDCVPEAKVTMAYDIGGPGDLSFNDAAQAGLQAAQADFRIRVTEFVLEPEDDRVAELTALAADGPALIFLVGFLWTEAVAVVAPLFPDTNFVLMDGVAPPSTNVQSAIFKEHEASFLVGAAAALTSTSGRVGFIGGVSGFGLIEEFEAGYVAGAMNADPGVVVDVRYLSAVPDFSGFFNPAAAYAEATDMYLSGADVIYHAAGGSGVGLFEAARDASPPQVWAIGVDSDQYLSAPPDLQPHILTSALKRFDTVVYEVIGAEVNGEPFQDGIVERGLAEDGVGYATSGGFVDVIVPILEGLRQDVIDGVIVVPTVP